MILHLTWGRNPADSRDTNHAVVATPDELDAALAQIAGDPAGPYMVHVAAPDMTSDTLQAGIGHHERAYVLWLGSGGNPVGYEPGVEPWPADIEVDYGGQAAWAEPAHTRVSPDTATAAVREFMSTGQRPTCLRWQPNEEPNGG